MRLVRKNIQDPVIFQLSHADACSGRKTVQVPSKWNATRYPGSSVRPPLTFRRSWAFRHHWFISPGQMPSCPWFTVFAHPNSTGTAVYPALLLYRRGMLNGVLSGLSRDDCQVCIYSLFVKSTWCVWEKFEWRIPFIPLFAKRLRQLTLFLSLITYAFFLFTFLVMSGCYHF